MQILFYIGIVHTNVLSYLTVSASAVSACIKLILE